MILDGMVYAGDLGWHGLCYARARTLLVSGAAAAGESLAPHPLSKPSPQALAPLAAVAATWVASPREFPLSPAEAPSRGLFSFPRPSVLPVNAPPR